MTLRAGNIIIKQDDQIINQLSCAKIFCLWIVGDCTLTTKLIDELLWYGISIYCLWSHLKPKFVIGNQLEWNYLLRIQQYQSDSDLLQAKHIVTNKIYNQLHLLKSLRSKSDVLKNTIKQIDQIISNIQSIDNIDSLRWYEWTAAKLFFWQYFFECDRYRRSPRTKIDVPNFLLDMWYGFLYNFMEAHLNLYGFDIYKWFYHTLFFERKSLVCDIIEPFRCIIDQTIRKAYNLGQINEKDRKLTKWQYRIDRETSKKYIKLFLEALMSNKKDIFIYTKWYYRAVINNQFNDLPYFYINQTLW